MGVLNKSQIGDIRVTKQIYSIWMASTTQGPGPCTQPNTCSTGNSSNPIRYFNGQILVSETDIDAGIPGFSHQRSFYSHNYKLTPWDSVQGWNWAVEAWPYLVLRSNTVDSHTTRTIVLKNGLSALWFDQQNDGTFVCRYGMNISNLLEALPDQGIYRYTQILGDTVQIIDFQDFNQPQAKAGMMVQQVDANSFVTTVTGYGNKCITSLETVRGSETYQLTYNYISSGIFSGKIDSVVLTITDDTGIRPIRGCRYLYYDGTTFEGLSGDLKAAIIQQPVNGTDPQQWEDIEVRYYRYSTEIINGVQPHLLTLKIGPTMYMLLKKQGQDVLTMTQSSNGPDLAPDYANNLFTYDNYNRVINEVARGGAADTGPEGLSYTRTFNPNVIRGASVVFDETHYNTWYWKIVEEGSSTLRKTIYTNDIGQILAEVSEDIINPTVRWIDAYHLDGNGSTILHAFPSAVAGIDESFPDLIGMRTDGTFSNLKENSGKIERSEYYATTTATATVAGGVQGYLQATYLQEGFAGTLIQQSETTYIASSNSSGPLTYMVASEIKFTSEDASSGITTSYSYLWTDNAGGQGLPRLQQKTTTLPAIPEDQGGDGIAHARFEYFDGNGNIIWAMDESGVITKKTYDSARQLLLQEIRDVDAIDTPPGWSILPGTHFNETTDYSYDDLSREICKLGPVYNAIVDSLSVNLRSAIYSCYLDAPLSGQSLFAPIVLNQKRQAGGYQLVIDQSDHIIDPVSIFMLDKCGRTVQQITSARSTGSGALSQSDTFLRSNWSRWQTFFFNGRGLPAGERVYHEIPSSNSGLDGIWNDIGQACVNYNESYIGYEQTRSLIIREVGSEGTITRYTYDVLSRKLNTYVGTQDISDCRGWEGWIPDCENSDMVLVNSQEYDKGHGGGDSLLTRTVNWLTNQTARITRYGYDFRGRLLYLVGEEGGYTEFTYDNLDRQLSQQQRNRDASGNVIARTESFYNDLSQIYKLQKYAVNPSTGVVGDYLMGSRSYNPVGKLVESVDPGAGGRTAWTAYDNLRRVVSVNIGFWNSVDASLIAVVIEGTSFSYDEDSNVIAKQRQQLDAGASIDTPTYRISYIQAWFDALGRLIASAELGALSSVPIYPSIPPPASATVLLSTKTYNDRGELYIQTDPAGRENYSVFDDKGRVIETIENYVSPGLPILTDSGINRTTKFTYTPDDQLNTLTAVLAGEENPLLQITVFEYGTDLETSGIASNKLLSIKIFADGNFESYTYTRQSEKASFSDANDTVHEYVYDGLGRLLHDKAVQLGEKITTGIRRISLTYEVRGMVSRISSASNVDTSQPYTVNEVQRIYDNFGDLITEYQEHAGAVTDINTSRKMTWTRNGGSNNTNRVTQMTYPTGRQYAFDYGIAGSASDLVDQLIEVDEVISGTGQTRVVYDYLGLNQIVKTTYPEPQSSLDLWGNAVGSYQGLDIFDRVIDQRWLTNTTDIARLQYGYDLASCRTYRRDVVAESLSKNFDELYSYDGLSQITALVRGKLSSTGNSIEAGTQNFYENFGFDLLGNWLEVESGNTTVLFKQDRSYSLTNEIVGVSTKNGNKWIKPRYDAVGNTTRTPKGTDTTKAIRIDYDAWNRPTWIYTFATDWTRLRVALYGYDGLGRRINELRYDAQSVSNLFTERLDHYYDNQWRTIATYSSNTADVSRPNTSGNLVADYLWNQSSGGYVDNLILRNAEERLYALQDAHYNMVGLVEADGTVVERFAYSTFGQAIYLDANFNVQTTSANSWDYLFSGRPRDSITGIDNVRYRDYLPQLGRWLTRDPIGERGGINLYVYVLNQPIDITDPLGLVPMNAILNTSIDPNAPFDLIIAAIVAKFAAEGDSLGVKGLLHYIDNSGTAMTLTKDEVKSIDWGGNPVNVFSQKKIPDAIIRVMKSKTCESISNAEGAYSTGSGNGNNLLGNFYVIMNGQVCCDKQMGWKFTGTFKIKDTYDFDIKWDDFMAGNSNRSFGGEMKTIFAHYFIPGKDYEVTSVDISLTQAGQQKPIW